MAALGVAQPERARVLKTPETLVESQSPRAVLIPLLVTT